MLSNANMANMANSEAERLQLHDLSSELIKQDEAMGKAQNDSHTHKHS